MTRTITILSAALLLLVGCAPNEQSDQAATSGEPDTVIALAGDFDGPLGLQLYSVRHEMEEDVAGTLAWVREAGFTDVELHSTYGMSPDSFRAELDQVGLDATAMHVGYETLEDSLQIALDNAELLGVEYIGVAWIPHQEDRPFTSDMARGAAADFNAWGEAAAERGLTFFYHVHGYEFQPESDGTVPLDVLLAETDPGDVTYEMDVFWVSHPGADPAALLREYPDRWKLMHIKDMRVGTTGDYSGHATEETNVPVGTGQIDYAEVLEAAEEIGLERYYIEDESTEPMTNVPLSIEFLEHVDYAEADTAAGQ